MQRTPLAARSLPAYSRGEECMNTVTHIVGGGFGVIALASCVVVAAIWGNAARVVGGAIYGASMILLYTMSSIYHGLKPEFAKKVMQVLDHCTIFLLIAGTYTPITLGPMLDDNPAMAWVVFGVEWGLAALGATLNAIDLKKYSVFSMICYLGMGWMIILSAIISPVPLSFGALMWLLAGGIAYTVGAVLYGLGKRKRYMHSIFHLFVLLGSILQFVCIILYVMPR